MPDTNAFEQGLRQYLSDEQLSTIQHQKIGIGGAGGLGSNVAMILVRTGFKHIEILDKDRIEPSNLNRQQYFIHEIGEEKVEITRRRLLEINPDINIRTHNLEWSTTNAADYFTDCDMIIEAFDQADFKFQFVDYYADRTRYVISGNGMAGLQSKEPLMVRSVGNVYLVGDGVTDAAEGHPPLAPRVIGCAAKMAEIVLDLTLGLPVRPT